VREGKIRRTLWGNAEGGGPKTRQFKNERELDQSKNVYLKEMGVGKQNTVGPLRKTKHTA